MLHEIIQRYNIPTQSCVLTHVTTSKAINRRAPVDLVFQSIAGTEAANKSFGINLSVPQGGLRGPNFSNAAPWAIMPCTLRPVRAVPAALGQRASRRRPADPRGAGLRGCVPKYKPLLVNTVVGFIGPEYLYDGRQIICAGLEDHFCGKLLGVPMGCDICYTNHAEADQNDMDTLLTLLGVAGITFIMGIPGSDDIMLNYQTTFDDALYARKALGLKPSPEFEDWPERGYFRKERRIETLAATLPTPFQRALSHLHTDRIGCHDREQQEHRRS